MEGTGALLPRQGPPPSLVLIGSTTIRPRVLVPVLFLLEIRDLVTRLKIVREIEIEIWWLDFKSREMKKRHRRFPRQAFRTRRLDRHRFRRRRFVCRAPGTIYVRPSKHFICVIPEQSWVLKRFVPLARLRARGADKTKDHRCCAPFSSSAATQNYSTTSLESHG